MNESETKDDIIYLLGVDEGSNPDGAVLTVDGKNILGGIEILVPYNETVKKTLSLSRTREDIENYDNIILSLSTVCQSDPTSNNPVIESTAEIAAHFVPSCGNININRKLDNTIINICQMDPTKDYGLKGIFPVEINDYDINNKKLETITIYYKSSVEGENGWRMLQQYYNNPGANQEKIPEGNIDFEWNLVDRNVRDGIYNVKAVALGKGNLRSETEVLTFTLDTKMPEVFGTPAPSSGVLRPGDDISITYNKNLQGSLILPSINENISVKGILNNQEIDHTTGILFDGKEGFMIMPNGVNLDNKSFTVEMWLKPLTYNKYQTVFTHGAGDNLFNMSFTADKRLEIKVGSKTYKSENTLNEDQFGNGFAQYQIIYNMSDAKLNVYVNNIHMLSLPSGAPDFTLSRWIFGCDENQANHFNGIIHDLRLWNSVIDATTLNKSLSGNEVDLIDYWPMDEISGSAVKDKARENHAVSKADRFIDPIGKCIELTGSEFVTVPLYALSKNYDFTIETWFKGKAQSAEATLFGNGSGRETSRNAEGEFNLSVTANGNLVYYSNNISYEVNKENVMDDQWHHVAVVADRTGTTSFYVDGELKNSYKGVSVGNMTGSVINLGANSYYKDQTEAVCNSFFKGYIDEFRFWNMALTGDQISLNRFKRLNGDEIGLSDYYPFDTFNSEKTRLVETKENQVSKKSDSAKFRLADKDMQASEKYSTGAGIAAVLPVSKVPFDWVLKDNQIIINLNKDVTSRQSYENCMLTVSTQDLYDISSNTSKPKSWNVYVDLKEVRWSTNSVSARINNDEEYSFDAEISNIGGSVRSYQIINLPAWIKASATSGKLNPMESATVTFTISSGLNIGTYDIDISLNELVSELYNEVLYTDKLSLNVKVGGRRPDWYVNPSDYEHSMSIYGDLKINGKASTNVEDLIGAFAGEECVGVVSPYYVEQYGKYALFMRVYGTDASSKDLNFRIWDSSTGNVYPASISEKIIYTSNAIYGSIANPVMFDTDDQIYQTIPLDNGWNWISFNVKSSHLNSASTLLNRLDANVSDIFKSQNKFTMYSRTDGWIETFGDSEALDVKTMYLLKTYNNPELNVLGTAITASSSPVDIKGGIWNYISYIPQQKMSVNEALANYQANEGDVIKSKDAFALYDATMGWIGDLETMRPGNGYILYRRSGGNVSFSYPDNAVSMTRAAAVADRNVAKAKINNGMYSDNMNIVAEIKGHDIQEGDMLVAIIGDTVRSVGSACTYNDKELCFITVPGNSEEKDNVRFAVRRDNEIIAEAKTTFSYSSNDMIGSLKSPVPINFGEIEGVNVSAYPNPFTDNIKFSITAKEAGNVRLEIYDIAGHLILIDSYKTESASSEYLWNGRSKAGSECEQGIYLVKVYAGDDNYVIKVKKQ